MVAWIVLAVQELRVQITNTITDPVQSAIAHNELTVLTQPGAFLSQNQLEFRDEYFALT